MSDTPVQQPAVKAALHTNLQPLNREAHRQMRVVRMGEQDPSATAGMNSLFVNAVEFFDVCREYPIVLVRASDPQEGGTSEVAPMAVLGLERGENLYLEGGKWTASYMPAHMRIYPFALVRPDENNYLVCFDSDWSGFSEVEGERLLDDEGQATEFMTGIQKFLETLDGEMQRTRQFCARLQELGLLQDMRFEANLSDGQQVVVEGFQAIDEKKLAELPEATVAELHRQGILSLIYALLVSMGNMRRLVERRVARAAVA